MLSGLLGGDPWLHRVNLTSHQVLSSLDLGKKLIFTPYLRNNQYMTRYFHDLETWTKILKYCEVCVKMTQGRETKTNFDAKFL